MRKGFKIDVEIDEERIIASPLGDGVDFLPRELVHELNKKVSTKSLLEEDENARLRGIEGVEVLAQKRVALLGVGAVGSWAGLYICPHVGELLLLDEDRVAPPNLKGRTVYLPSQVGQFKVYALEEILKSHNPDLKIEAFVCNINQAPQSLLQKILQYDLVICAIDDLRGVLKVDSLTYGRVPTLYSGVYQRGRSGFVVIVTRETPSFKQSMQITENEQQIETLHRESALGIDITKIALTTVQLAVYLLIQDISPEFAGVIDLKRSNFLWIHNRRGPMLGEGLENIWLPVKS